MNLTSRISFKTLAPRFLPKVKNWERRWWRLGLTLLMALRLMEGEAIFWSLGQVRHLASLMRKSMMRSIAVVEQNCCMKLGGRSASNLGNYYKEYNQNMDYSPSYLSPWASWDILKCTNFRGVYSLRSRPRKQTKKNHSNLFRPLSKMWGNQAIKFELNSNSDSGTTSAFSPIKCL